MTIMTSKGRVILENNDSSNEENDSETSEKSRECEGDQSESNSEKANSGESENETNAGNPSWADSISKILNTNKPKGKKTIVLSKAKKLCNIKQVKTKSIGFQVATTDGEIKEETIKEESEDVEQPRKKKRELPNLRQKPNILNKDRERTLTKIATKGVVQLFNAVRMQQKDISNKLKEAGPLEVNKDKVLKSIDKRAFLDVLMGEKSQIVDQNTNVKECDKDKTWSVLRDDFMMSAKLKDWDKELEREEEMEVE